jgi:hypothetical protein
MGPAQICCSIVHRTKVLLMCTVGSHVPGLVSVVGGKCSVNIFACRSGGVKVIDVLDAA